MSAYRAPTRFTPLIGLVFLLSGISFSFSLRAHEGHDHGPAVAQPAWAAAEPRVAAGSSAVAITGILKADRLWLYVDGAGSNEPLQDLNLEIEVAGNTRVARPEGAGIYSVPATWAQAGRHDLTFTVRGRELDDLLIGTLEVPESPAPGRASVFRHAPLSAALLSVLFVGYVIFRKRSAHTLPRPLRASRLAVLGLSVVAGVVSTGIVAAMLARTAPADAAGPGSLMRQPIRLPDGSVMVPKPAQRILSIRTERATISPLRRTHVLSGRVVENPNSSALIRAEQPGRLEPPAAGFPVLGAKVRKGQVLAYLQPTLTVLEAARREADLYVLEKERYLAARQYERVKTQMGVRDTGSSVVLDVARAELRAFEQQIAALKGIPNRRIAVVAPVAGVIGASSVATGKIVQVGDDFFRVWDPQGNWVEAISFQPGLEAHVVAAKAVLDDSSVVPLTYSGHGYQMQNQGLVLQFRPDQETQTLLVGRLVAVHVATDEVLQGMRVPRDSVISAANTAPYVWVHAEAERFEQRPVDVIALDDRFSVITGGIGPRERLVTAGASLISRVP